MQRITHWLSEAQAWLDARGKGAWIAVMVIGFIFFWPIGLALLFYMIWSNRMSRPARHWSPTGASFRARHSTGNTAFDGYRDATLQRLEDEQAAFQEFLERLRKAKDQSEFDQFMEDRARRRTDARDQTTDDCLEDRDDSRGSDLGAPAPA